MCSVPGGGSRMHNGNQVGFAQRIIFFDDFLCLPGPLAVSAAAAQRHGDTG